MITNTLRISFEDNKLSIKYSFFNCSGPMQYDFISVTVKS